MANPWTREPLVHSYLTDCLPDDHPRARVTIHCSRCREMVHCENGECMQTWVELPDRDLCAPCFGATCAVLPPDAVSLCKASIGEALLKALGADPNPEASP